MIVVIIALHEWKTFNPIPWDGLLFHHSIHNSHYWCCFIVRWTRIVCWKSGEYCSDRRLVVDFCVWIPRNAEVNRDFVQFVDTIIWNVWNMKCLMLHEAFHGIHETLLCAHGSRGTGHGARDMRKPRIDMTTNFDWIKHRTKANRDEGRCGGRTAAHCILNHVIFDST